MYRKVYGESNMVMIAHLTTSACCVKTDHAALCCYHASIGSFALDARRKLMKIVAQTKMEQPLIPLLVQNVAKLWIDSWK